MKKPVVQVNRISPSPSEPKKAKKGGGNSPIVLARFPTGKKKEVSFAPPRGAAPYFFSGGWDKKLFGRSGRAGGPTSEQPALGGGGKQISGKGPPPKGGDNFAKTSRGRGELVTQFQKKGPAAR